MDPEGSKKDGQVRAESRDRQLGMDSSACLLIRLWKEAVSVGHLPFATYDYVTTVPWKHKIVRYHFEKTNSS